jgi:hypothetical protein
MPRRPRLRVAGLPVHIIQRGNNRQACFFADEDYQHYWGQTPMRSSVNHDFRFPHDPAVLGDVAMNELAELARAGAHGLHAKLGHACQDFRKMDDLKENLWGQKIYGVRPLRRKS